MEDITIIKNFLPDTKKYYDNLLNRDNFWTDEITISGTDTKKKINRMMAYISDIPTIYKYVNFEFEGKTWDPLMLELNNMLIMHTGFKFNSVLLNFYRNGKDEIKWHSDKEDTLGDNPIIACINLGATRKFWFLNKETGEKTYKEVSDGDLLIMGENCQTNYLHAILKEKEITEPRISLTFRYNY